jgi:outer membrane protein W
MATKAEIEKDLEDPSIKALRLEQLKAARGSFESDLGNFILSAKGAKVKPKALEQFARIKAKEHGETFTVVDEGTTIPEDGSGYYMIENKIFRVVDGAPQQVV